MKMQIVSNSKGAALRFRTTPEREDLVSKRSPPLDWLRVVTVEEKRQVSHLYFNHAKRFGKFAERIIYLSLKQQLTMETN